MTAKTTASGVAYDVSGRARRPETPRRRHAGLCTRLCATAAIHMESCVRCGMCANACQFYVTTGDPKYTPINKLKPFEQAYHRHVGPFAPLYRLLGMRSNVVNRNAGGMGGADLRRLLRCAGGARSACPMGIDIAELIKEARHGMYKAGLVPDRLELMDRTAKAWGSPATPADDFADIIREAGEENGVPSMSICPRPITSSPSRRRN